MHVSPCCLDGKTKTNNPEVVIDTKMLRLESTRKQTREGNYVDSRRTDHIVTHPSCEELVLCTSITWCYLIPPTNKNYYGKEMPLNPDYAFFTSFESVQTVSCDQYQVLLYLDLERRNY